MSTSSASPDRGLRPQSVVGVPLGSLARSAGSDLPAGSVDPQVTGITLRAQGVRPGDMFAALPGTRVHGAVFAADAIRAGATCVLTDRAGAAAIGADPAVPVLVVEDPRAVLGAVSSRVYGDPSRSLAVIGVTGTSGKTTTGYLLEAALAGPDHRVGLVGTVETRIDGRPSKSLLTTPEAPDLQALFAVMVEQGVDTVAMEVSSHALSLGRVAGTRFEVGAFTNLSQDHLDFHPDMESYFQAKAMLFDGRARTGVIDVDDEYGTRLAALHPDAATVSIRPDRRADWTVTDVRTAGAGRQRFTAHRPAGAPLPVELALPGHFNVANALVALACVAAAGRDVERAAEAMGRVVVPGRMERVDAGQPFLVVVDYAHKPAALSAVLEAIATGLTGRLIVVVGAGGDRDVAKRPMMGAAAAALADLLIVTDDNPRSEPPSAIRAAVLTGARNPGPRGRPGKVSLAEIGDRQHAIRTAIAAARPGDAVVIAGKGHEQGQDVGGVIHPFSDRVEAQAALATLGHRTNDQPALAPVQESRDR
ncbi:UDP-N-acetylmuramoylalanyl-D-glutamate--2,6-diaminopimelate ligase [Nakamurella panacisegetis]|uniref:UDP-N-acetylmuramoyl-L-alanyl-D-glutamate--2,6-diaminopimelate ligase n=1 Tax=Nakamurella panacisegetis TaxID=1090615 RepID=A0A1H0QA78_9ACTN|nr:UDP-N-acetylmuramoyl-L-alanyl-D-glutamate--2,6-diaminopimelate ligase [Nakamurella panacisegetis]SDP13589.1 UDP-N-acetylmuramoylalanyl-D-glutamate--2,6-diaminopimelate ligase [Nakamurella panacisegetis]